MKKPSRYFLLTSYPALRPQAFLVWMICSVRRTVHWWYTVIFFIIPRWYYNKTDNLLLNICVPGIVLRHLHVLSHLILTETLGSRYYIPVLLKRKLRLKKMNHLFQDYIAKQGRYGILTQGVWLWNPAPPVRLIIRIITIIFGQSTAI